MKNKKLISLILSAAMMVSLLPVWAEGGLLESGTANGNQDYEATGLLSELIYAQPGESVEQSEPTLGGLNAKETVAASEDGTLVAKNGYWHETMDQYQNFDYSDPNWITDETFFGKWNGSYWLKRPYIDYSCSPMLQEAEDAVKDGDYELAKEFVYEYYKAKFESQPRVKTGTTNRIYRLIAELMFDNLFCNGASGFVPSDKFYVPGEWGEVSANVIEAVQSISTSTQKEQCFVITALKKDGCQVDFNSVNAAENKPYIRVTVNGINKTFYPTKDVMVSAGLNASTNYRNETMISVQEAAIDEAEPVNSDTKRIYMNFDFSEITAGDEITEARLYLYGKSTNPDGKDVVLFTNSNPTWYEETVTWDSLSHLIFSYDGESGPKWVQPNGAGSRFEEDVNRFGNHLYMYQSYYSTDDEIYAYHALRIWLDFYKKKGNIPGYRKNLDVGVRASSLVDNLAYFIDSEFMTKEVFTPLLKFVWGMGEALVECWNDTSRTSNWGSWETAGLNALAMNFSELYDAYEPLEEGATEEQGGRGGWINVAGYRYEVILGNVINADGSGTEASLEYVGENIVQAMKQTTDAAAIGWTDFTLPPNLQTLAAALARYLVNASGPNFVDFQHGDASSYTTSYLSRINTVNTYVDDQLLQWASSGETEGTAPDYTSVLYPVGGKIILRSGWKAKDTYIETNVDGGLGGHSHWDDMGLNMFAYGQYLLVDPRYLKQTDAYLYWLNSTRAHNTVEINDSSMKARSSGTTPRTVTGPVGETLQLPSGASVGTVVESELNDAYDFVYLNTPNYLDVTMNGEQIVNVDYDRSILFIRPGYAIVTDYLKPQDDNVNKYSQAWHFLPTAEVNIDEETGAVRTNFADTANIQVIPVQTDDVMESSLQDGWYSYNASNVTSAKYATYVKNQAGDTTFNTVLLPSDVGQELDAYTENIAMDVSRSVANAFRLTFENAANNLITKGTYYTLLDRTQQAQRDFDSYSTDGTLTYVEQENDSYSRVILRAGTNVVNTKNSQKLLRSVSEMEDLSVTYSSSKIKLNSSKTVNLEELQLYSGNKKITEVTLNGKSIRFKQDGTKGDIYFAATMPFEGNEADEDSNNNSDATQNVTGGSVHGSSGGGGGGSVTVSTATPTPNETTGSTPTPTPTLTPNTQLSEQYRQELSGHWAETEISEMLEKGVIEGTGAGVLELSSQTTRAEFVTMLVRALGLELQDYDGEYADVSAEDWYADYIATATKEGILQGDGTNANPNDLITREEMAKILVETYERENGEIEVTAEEGERFRDLVECSNWAEEYVCKAIAAELMNGMSEDRFAPLEHALREQAIVVIYRIKKA